jgi:hypothetical protein
MCVALLTTNVQLLISKNQQQILHGNIQIVQAEPTTPSG